MVVNGLMPMTWIIIDDIDNGMIDEDSDGEDELFDSVCAICDNGGQLLWYIFFVGYFNFV